MGGRLRMVAVLLPRRSSLVPDVPTIAEAGMPGVSISPWQGVEVQTSTAAELTVHTHDQYLAWSKVIRETGIPQE